MRLSVYVCKWFFLKFWLLLLLLLTCYSSIVCVCVHACIFIDLFFFPLLYRFHIVHIEFGESRFRRYKICVCIMLSPLISANNTMMMVGTTATPGPNLIPLLQFQPSQSHSFHRSFARFIFRLCTLEWTGRYMLFIFYQHRQKYLFKRTTKSSLSSQLQFWEILYQNGLDWLSAIRCYSVKMKTNKLRRRARCGASKPSNYWAETPHRPRYIYMSS